MYTFSCEKIEDVRKELEPLLVQHWQELANYKDIRPLSIDWDKYLKLNELGYIVFLTVREEGKLIGYASFTIAMNLHYSTWKHAVSDVYYVIPEKRSKGLGIEFFSFISQWMLEEGVNLISIQDKVDFPHDKLFTALGYKMTERHFEKVL